MQSNNNPILVRYSKRILNKFNDIILYALTIKVDIIFFLSFARYHILPLLFSVSAHAHTHNLFYHYIASLLRATVPVNARMQASKSEEIT